MIPGRKKSLSVEFCALHAALSGCQLILPQTRLLSWSKRWQKHAGWRVNGNMDAASSTDKRKVHLCSFGV